MKFERFDSNSNLFGSSSPFEWVQMPSTVAKPTRQWHRLTDAPSCGWAPLPPSLSGVIPVADSCPCRRRCYTVSLGPPLVTTPPCTRRVRWPPRGRASPRHWLGPTVAGFGCGLGWPTEDDTTFWPARRHGPCYPLGWGHRPESARCAVNSFPILTFVQIFLKSFELPKFAEICIKFIKRQIKFPYNPF
jgi:hypothetical protein